MNKITLLLIILSIVTVNSVYSQSKEIKFSLYTATHTPEDEFVVLYSANHQFYPMSKTGEKTWEVSINLNYGSSFAYYYCRNFMQHGAEEEEYNNFEGYRTINITSDLTVKSDTVSKWKWWPTDGLIPEIDYSSHLNTKPTSNFVSDFQCGVELPDFWWPQFMPVVPSTLDKIVANSNANWVQYAPVPEITQFYPTPIININGNNSTPEQHLLNIITEAHNRGLKVFLRPFHWALTVNDSSPDNHSDNWWINFSNQWLPIILYYARISEQYGVEMIDLNLWNGHSETHKPILDSLLCNMVDSVRNVYGGLLSMELHPWGDQLEVYNKVDFLSFKIWDVWPFHLSDSKDPTTYEMAEALRQGFDTQLKPWCEFYNKKLILSEIAASSLDGSVNGSASVWENEYYDPIDTSTHVDLQEQADVYEAMLIAISERDWISGAYSFNYNYWNSVDKVPSIRNKPSENVLAKWWRWINPNQRHLTIKTTTGGSTVPSSASYVLNMDTTITISANAEDGFIFSHWSGDLGGIDPSSSTAQILLNEDKIIKAIFILDPTGVTNKNEIPLYYNLFQNYPNPFNPITNMKFGLPKSSFVVVNIYNSLGQKVSSLLNKKMGAGYHTIQWGNPKLSSGVYFYQIITDEFVDTKKMVLIK